MNEVLTVNIIKQKSSAQNCLDDSVCFFTAVSEDDHSFKLLTEFFFQDRKILLIDPLL